MKRPNVSIIVPIYNVEKYLERCMDSLLNQTLKDIEIIMVDDGSPDNCPQMCDEYAKKDGRVKVIHKKNAGLGMARNSGLEIASGEYVAFVDSDDFVQLDAYEILYNEATNTKSDYVLCGYNRIKDNECVWTYHSETSCNSDLFKGAECLEVLKGMIGRDIKFPRSLHFDFAVWHGIYRNQLIKDNLLRFCSERDLISEDIVFHLSFIPHCNIIRTISNGLYNYCENQGTLTTKYKPGRFKAILKLHAFIESEVKKQAWGKGVDMAKRLDYLLVDKVISTISYVARFNKKNANSEIADICNNLKVQAVFRNYPIRELQMKKKLIGLLIRLKFSLGLYLLFNLKNK